jgi:hypothetical protein
MELDDIAESLQPDTVLSFSHLPRGTQKEIVAEIGWDNAIRSRWAVFWASFPAEPVVIFGVDRGHRLRLTEKKLLNLQRSIQRRGVERPVVVDTGKFNHPGGYSWMEGFHRALLSHQLGLGTVPLYFRVA